jgi:hypothetical protein
MSTAWSHFAFVLSLLKCLLLSKGFQVRVDIRIFQLSTDQASDGIGSLFECKWRLALCTIYKVDDGLFLIEIEFKRKAQS